jgi:CheY-like chemotaxis protein
MKVASPVRILLVDDYPDVLEVGRLYLSTCGFEVMTAADGQAALELATDGGPNGRPDLIILDLELPKIGGIDVARRLRADPDTAATPLIAVTGHSDKQHLDEARGAGFDIVLTKPCNPSVLRSEIQRLLDLPAAGAV